MGSIFSLISQGLAKAVGSSGKGTKDDASLLVNGKVFDGWTEIQIKRSLKAISGAFELKLIDKWAEQKVAWQIVPNDECVLKVGDETLITGYVDSVNPTFSNTTRSVSVSGRDKSADLVDCSAEHKPGNWTNISLERLCNIVCKPFGVKVTNSVTGLKPFLSWRINEGEAGFETLDRAAKMSGVLLVSDGDGGIVITRASTDRAATRLEQGVNILSGSANYETKERFSKYTVKGQMGGYDNEVPAVDFATKAVVTDSFIKRFRPITIISEGAATLAICQLRAKWEMSFRSAKSARFNIVVQGWKQENGSLWTTNKVVNLNSNFLGINQDFLITSVTFSKTSGGTLTNLELERPDAYTPDPTIRMRAAGEAIAQLVQEDKARR